MVPKVNIGFFQPARQPYDFYPDVNERDLAMASQGHAFMTPPFNPDQIWPL